MAGRFGKIFERNFQVMYMINYSYLRPKKAKALKNWTEKSFIKRTDIKAYSYKNATILPLKKFESDNLLFGRGGVVDENGKYIDISAIDNRVQNSYEYTSPLKEDKKVVYCGYLVNQWGHFLVEAVSRMWYFLKNDSSIDNYVFFVSEDEQRGLYGNYKEFFELLGVYNKIEIINKPTTFNEVIIPERGYKWREYYSDEYKNIFDTIAKNIKIDFDLNKYEKIFFTRSQLNKVSETEFGTEMIDNFFEKNGYKIIAPEKYSLSEMIFYIRNAKICAFVSGSLPHNMLFGNDGQELIILERNIYNNEIQVDVNHIKDLNVTYIDANIGIYPINLGYGPFIMSYRGMLERFCTDNNMTPPDEKFYTKQYLKKCFKKYIKCYKRAYCYQWFMEDWSVKYTDYLREAYLDGLQYFGGYLSGEEPFKISQYFSLHFIKKTIKKLIK